MKLTWSKSSRLLQRVAFLVVFDIKNFHEQLYVKECLVEDTIWEIAVCSTCRKQSEYFDKRDAARFLICYIYNGAFYDNSLHVEI